MSNHPIDPRDILLSLVAAALTAAEADAAASDAGLKFRPEWRPTHRTRSSMILPEDTAGVVDQSSFWSSFPRNHPYRSGHQLQQDQPLLPASPPAKPTPPSASAAPPAYTSVPPPPAASVSTLPLPPGPLPPPQPQPQEEAVAELLKRNQDVFDEVINHPFPQALGKGTASLDGFRYYMIVVCPFTIAVQQDMFYLETCARLKMNAVASSPNFADIETFEFRHKSSIEYVKKLKEICITMLGIPESTIKNTPRSVQLDTSERFYKDCLRNEDALLAYYVVLLPCVLTYWRIAERLWNDPSTAKNVVYYPAWIVVNHDPSSVGKYIKFINENIAAKGGVDRWNYTFRIACLLEAGLFNTGWQASTPFQIIPNGTYSIHVSSEKSVVLAIQNVKDLLRPPLDKLPSEDFSSNAGSPVVGIKKTGGDNERWHVAATKAGYTFQNLATGFYLGMSTESDREGRVLRPVLAPYYWWINPVSSQGSPVYQIYDSKNLRYTLHADIEGLNKIGLTNFRYTPIISHENSKVYCQMWSFNSLQGSDGGEGGTTGGNGGIRSDHSSARDGAAAGLPAALRAGPAARPRSPVGLDIRRETSEKIKNIVARTPVGLDGRRGPETDFCPPLDIVSFKIASPSHGVPRPYNGLRDPRPKTVAPPFCSFAKCEVAGFLEGKSQTLEFWLSKVLLEASGMSRRLGPSLKPCPALLFTSLCVSLLGRMLETVLAWVQFTEVTMPLPVRPSNIQLVLTGDILHCSGQPLGLNNGTPSARYSTQTLFLSLDAVAGAETMRFLFLINDEREDQNGTGFLAQANDRGGFRWNQIPHERLYSVTIINERSTDNTLRICIDPCFKGALRIDLVDTSCAIYGEPYLGAFICNRDVYVPITDGLAAVEME
ncbi:hypothetical protein K438DRAFT_1779223 [Mycena galopus ATCC 62051]|nr:hypothetical protein K438DRAFT_1779223 [Mycena galopus ATCC 62051]